MIQIYGNPMSTCTRKVLMTLAETNTPFEMHVVDFTKGEHKQEAHVRRQPFGRIPALEDDGFEIILLLGARQLGVPPQRCVVFEDALVGLEAARAGGMKAVGVATTHPPESLTGADLVVRRLDELSVAAREQLFSAR